MKNTVKKNIRILSEKFDHWIEYQKDVMVLKGRINEIKIWETDKYGIDISYNIDEKSVEQLKVKAESIYDIILELLTRNRQEQKLGKERANPITIEEWIEEEGDFAKEQLEKLKKDLQHEDIEYRELGGNRYEAEYYKGILILMDDLCFSKSNVIHIDQA